MYFFVVPKCVLCWAIMPLLSWHSSVGNVKQIRELSWFHILEARQGVLQAFIQDHVKYWKSDRCWFHFLLSNKLWFRIRNTTSLENMQKPLRNTQSMDLIRLRTKLQWFKPDPLLTRVSLLESTQGHAGPG